MQSLNSARKKKHGAWKVGSIAKGSPNLKPTTTFNNNNGRKAINWKNLTKDNYAFELGMLIGKMIHSTSKVKTESEPNIKDKSIDIESINENNEDKYKDGEVEVVE